MSALVDCIREHLSQFIKRCTYIFYTFVIDFFVSSIVYLFSIESRAWSIRWLTDCFEIDGTSVYSVLPPIYKIVLLISFRRARGEISPYNNIRGKQWNNICCRNANSRFYCLYIFTFYISKRKWQDPMVETCGFYVHCRCSRDVRKSRMM